MHYSKSHLLKRLKDEGLPHTYKTLLRYEKAGIINTNDRIQHTERSWRLYTSEEIENIVSSIKNYKG